MKKRTREALTADFTPLIDVVFLLLIFFLVATAFKKEELALLLSLPEAKQAGLSNGQQDSKNIQIELSGEDLAYNGKKISFEELDLSLQSIKDNKTLFELRIDKEVKYERVVRILDSLKKYSLTNIELVTLK